MRALQVGHIKSIENSNQPHAEEYIFKQVDDRIKDIGKQHVVQIVINNIASKMSAKAMVKVVHPSLFLSNYAAHTIDLMLENIGKLPKYNPVIRKHDLRCLPLFPSLHFCTHVQVPLQERPCET